MQLYIFFSFLSIKTFSIYNYLFFYFLALEFLPYSITYYPNLYPQPPSLWKASLWHHLANEKLTREDYNFGISTHLPTSSSLPLVPGSLFSCSPSVLILFSCLPTDVVRWTLFSNACTFLFRHTHVHHGLNTTDHVFYLLLFKINLNIYNVSTDTNSGRREHHSSFYFQ